jgi:uncharacterized protein (TIGR02594 family)
MSPVKRFFNSFQSAPQVHVRHKYSRHASRKISRHASRGAVYRTGRDLSPAIKPTGNSLVAIAKSQVGKGAIYGRRTLWCATFMNWALAKAGYEGTGSDVARSFERFGQKIAKPVIGAIAVLTRRGGGHVGIVTGVTEDGNPILVSGNFRHRVAEAVYPQRRVVTYVMP